MKRPMMRIIALCVSMIFNGAMAEISRPFSHKNDPQNRFLDRPKINDGPSAILNIHGRKHRDLEVYFFLTFTTRNSDCKSQNMIPELLFGAPKTPQVVRDVFRVPEGQETFDLHIELDKYIPGTCAWGVLSLMHGPFTPSFGVREPTYQQAVVVFERGSPNQASVEYKCWIKQADNKINDTFCYPRLWKNTHMSPDGGQLDLVYDLSKP